MENLLSLINDFGDIMEKRGESFGIKRASEYLVNKAGEFFVAHEDREATVYRRIADELYNLCMESEDEYAEKYSGPRCSLMAKFSEMQTRLAELDQDDAAEQDLEAG